MWQENKERIEKYQKARLSLNLRTIREEKGLSQEELAKKVGYETKSSIVALENGSRLPGTGKNDVKDIDLANALEISLDQLWGRKRADGKDGNAFKMSSAEKTALTLLAPMMEAMSDEGREYIVRTALLVLKAEGKSAKWQQASFQKSNQETK